MKAVMGRENRLTIFLTTLALVLIAVLVWEGNQGLRLERELLKMRSIPVVAAPLLKILPEFTLPEEEAGFPDLVSRSLFSINRRSSAVATKGGVAVMKKGQFVLVGVLITPQQSSAQLRDVQTNKAETVALNGVVRNMTIGEVGPSRVVLRQGSESEELILNVQTGPKVGDVARAPPAPVPAGAPVAPASAPPAPPPSPAASGPARAASGITPPASVPSAPPSTPKPPVDLKKPQ